MYQFINPDGTFSGTAKRLVSTNFEARNPDSGYSAQGHVHGVIWQDNRTGHNQVFFSTVSESGERAPEDIRISDNTTNVRTPRLTVSPDGTFYVTYTDNRSGRNQVYVVHLDFDGTIIGGPVQVSSSSGEAFYPDIVMGASMGVIWMDNRAGNYQIYFSRLNDDLEILNDQKKISSSFVQARTASSLLRTLFAQVCL
jgi:hypothetical protein